MPFQAPSWTEFYVCPICGNDFSVNQRLPISLGCGHTICRLCLGTFYNSQCPFDQTTITTDIDSLPINTALLQLFNTNNNEDEKHSDVSKSITIKSNSEENNNNNNNSNNVNKNVKKNNNAECSTYSFDIHRVPPSVRKLNAEDLKSYKSSKRCIEELAQYLKTFLRNNGNLLTRPMLRKLVTLVNCQLMEEEGRVRAVRTARLLGERTVTELLLQHQNPQQLSVYLWAAVRSRGCQFLGPTMQEEVLKLVLKALENGTALSRKVLVMYVVQRLVENLLPASKTSIGHVVQLLYRASCFKVSKREGDSSLMQLKEEFRNYEALRREHDAQIVQIATEAGLRIAPDQWSSLLYGSISHKSHMQSICDTLQSPSSFSQSVQELVLALQRTGDPTNLFTLRPHLKHLSNIDISLESSPPLWQDVENALSAVRQVVLGLVKFVQFNNNQNSKDYLSMSASSNSKYKISLCRDLTKKRICPRGENCTFAHSTEERQRYRAKHRRSGVGKLGVGSCISSDGDDSISQRTTMNKNTESIISTANNVKVARKVSPQHLKQLSNQHNIHTQNIMKTCKALKLHKHSNCSTPPPVKVKNSPKRQIAVSETIINKLVVSGTKDSCTFTDLPLNLPFHKEDFYSTIYNKNTASPVLSHEFNLHPSVKAPRGDDFHESNFSSFNSLNYNSGRCINMPSASGPNLISMNARGGPSTMGISTTLNVQQSNMTTVVNPPNSFNTPIITNQQLENSQYCSNKEKTLFNNSTTNFFYHKDTEESNERNVVVDRVSSSLFFSNKPLDVNSVIGSIDIQSIETKFPPGFSSKSNVTHEASLNMWDTKYVACNDLLQGSQNLMHVTSAIPESTTFLIDKNSCLESPEKFIRKYNNNDLIKSENHLLLWKPGNNLNKTAEITTTNSIIKNDDAMNIKTSLFHDRDSFVRSDSILDDDTSTFDVPTTAATSGSKYGPICPMHKGSQSKTTSKTTNDINCNFINHRKSDYLDYTWNDINVKTDNPYLTDGITSDNIDRSMFAMDNGNYNGNNDVQLSPLFHDYSQPTVRTLHASTAMPHNTECNGMQTVLSKLSHLDFNTECSPFIINSDCNERNNSVTKTGEQMPLEGHNLSSFKFDLSPLSNILDFKPFSADIKKTFNLDHDHEYDLTGTNAVYHYRNQQQQLEHEQHTISFNNLWSDDATCTANRMNTTLPSLVKTPKNIEQEQSYSNLCKEQNINDKHRRVETISDKDNRLGVTNITDNIWPCIDNNNCKYD